MGRFIIFTQDVIWMIKSKRTRWRRGVCHTYGGEDRNKVLVVEDEGRRPFGEDGTIILEWKLEKLNGNSWNGFIWLKTGTSGGLL
jgi:hypothetical protein